MSEVIKVRAPSLAQAGESVAQTAVRAAVPHPAATPAAALGSPADGALASFAGGIAAQSAAMASQVAGRGPAMQAATQAGISELLGADEQNVDTIRSLGPQASPVPPGAATSPGEPEAGASSLRVVAPVLVQPDHPAGPVDT